MSPRHALAVAAGLLFCTTSTVFAVSPAERKLSLPERPYSYTDTKLPANFEERWVKALDTTPVNNPTTDAGAALGRVLFYDTRLSSSGTVSCGTCHLQKQAFAQPTAVSIGHEGRQGDRNAMSLVNLRFSRAGFFWDERAETLEEAVGLPVRSRLEMAGPGGPAIEKAVSADTRYSPLFKAAFGESKVTEERIRLALAQFIRAMVSCDSPYDRAASQATSVKEDFAAFSPEENRGKTLFLQHCNLCHHIGEGKHVAFFDMFRSLNNGIDPDANVPDGGRGDITLNPTEVGQFRASSLRNVAVTAPYMHDGRLATLEEVIEHYSTGVMRHPNAGAVGRFQFSASEKAALVAFLKTLTDEAFLSDPRFADPWVSETPASPTEVVTNSVTKPEPRQLDPVADRLARGEGMQSGEAPQWLNSLDTNGDKVLSKAELGPLVDLLAKTRVGALGAGRTRGGGGPGGGGGRGPGGGRGRTATAPAENGDAQGDFDGDGKVTDAEAAAYASFKRLTELGDGGPLRRLVRTDRFLGGFSLTVDQAETARTVLNAGRAKLDEQMQALDRELLAKFEELAGQPAVAQFEKLVIDRQVGEVRVRTASADDAKGTAERLLVPFDQDRDDNLSGDEIAALGAALDRLSGGLGQAPPQPIGMEQFTRRFVAYDPAGKGSVAIARLPERLVDFAVRGDRDGNAILSPQEIDDYIRSRAFGHLLVEGIYIGGGFANALDRHAELLADIGLAEASRAAAESLFARHAAQIESLKREAIAEQFGEFRAAVGNQAPAASNR